jgi:hypothetical protein
MTRLPAPDQQSDLPDEPPEPVQNVPLGALEMVLGAGSLIACLAGLGTLGAEPHRHGQPPGHDAGVFLLEALLTVFLGAFTINAGKTLARGATRKELGFQVAPALLIAWAVVLWLL